jgi:hypothetical protein
MAAILPSIPSTLRMPRLNGAAGQSDGQVGSKLSVHIQRTTKIPRPVHFSDYLLDASARMVYPEHYSVQHHIAKGRMMGMSMLFDGATPQGEGVWSVVVPAHQVTHLGQPKVRLGSRSVLLVERPVFDVSAATIRVDVDSILVLNQGTTATALVIEAKQEPESTKGEPENAQPEVLHHGPGDREFIQLVEQELVGEARQAALAVLKAVRGRSPGDLQRGQRNNFKNTPDNFWYVIVQPRVQALSITVRGDPQRFSPSRLNPKDDRPGYTRFSICRSGDVAEAVRIIEQSKRQ